MLQIYNTMSRRKEAFQPLEAGKVRMYVCGVTTYDYCHLGHARMLVVFDVVVRTLRWLGYEVTYVRNITDIDDKILKRADEQGIDYRQLTEKFIAIMHEDEAALNIAPPDREPRATAHMDEIIAMIKVLVDKGYAYAADNGDVYYAVRQFPDYTRLSQKNLDELQAGARIEVEEAKRDPRDFALWKAAKPGEPGWESPWGFGRPGWHIECSAMSTCCLGNTFDIHGGGSDLIFPHHENEIAQSEAATGEQFARLWMHNGPLRVDNEKMSKSLGNFFTIRDVLEKYPAEVVRYFLVSSHYRSPINYSADNLDQAYAALARFYNALKGLDLNLRVFPDEAGSTIGFHKVNFENAMEDDFNTPKAIGVLFDLARDINKIKEESVDVASALGCFLVELGETLGILQSPPEEFLREGSGEIDPLHIEDLISRRNQARADKNWAEADRIRDALKSMQVVLEDKDGKTSWRVERQ